MIAEELQRRRLPDPVTLDDGRRVQDATDWRRRRTEILAVLGRDMCGVAPAAPALGGADTKLRKPLSPDRSRRTAAPPEAPALPSTSRVAETEPTFTPAIRTSSPALSCWRFSKRVAIS